MTMTTSRRFVVMACICPMLTATSIAQDGALASWNEGATKDAILEFVASVTTAGSQDFVPVDERIANRLALIRERLAALTTREREIFEQVAAGYLNKQISANLGISEKTVKVHRARVMRKMCMRSVAELARAAEQIGVESQVPE